MNYLQVIEKTKQNGGITMNTSGEEPKNGFMVSLIGNEKKLRLKKFTVKNLKKYLNDNYRYLNSENMYFGTWIDKKTVYLDISLNIKDERKAILAGKVNKQKAIYYIDEKKVINL